VFRVDSEFRSLPPMHRAAELVRNGRLGKLYAMRTGVPKEPFPEEAETVTDPPPEHGKFLWRGK
jgi:predicted dehydrogenase